MVYSVLKEPVIPVLWLNGTESSVGIRDAILRAHEIRDIQGDTPLERYALLRLLIAFCMDMMHPGSSSSRRDLLDAGKFNPDSFDDYVAMCEKDGPRFDLFDAEHPFLQSTFDPELDTKAEKPVAAIIHSLPSGNNHIFLDHRTENTHTVSCEKAFRAVCASYVFCVSGTAGPSSINNTPPLYAVIIGANLFETIVLNVLSVAETGSLPYGVGQVPWREYPFVRPKEKVPDVSLLEGLTWMPRRITLIPEEDQVVCRVYCQAGLDFRGNDLWNDPHVPKFKKKDGTYGTIKPELGRAAWRDVGTLLYDRDGTTVRQPHSIRCISNLYDDDEMPYWIAIRTAGLITNQAAYTGWCEDELSIPSLLLHSQEEAELFRSDVAMIESMQARIYSTVQMYVDKPRSGGVGKEHETAQQCQQFFLQGAHDLLFGETMNDICNHSSEKEHVIRFCESVGRLLRDMIREVLRNSGRNAKAMLQQIEAEKWLWFAFNKITEERKKQYGGA